MDNNEILKTLPKYLKEPNPLGLSYLNSYYPEHKTQWMDMEAGELGVNPVPVKTSDRFYNAEIVDKNIQILKKEIERLKHIMETWESTA